MYPQAILVSLLAAGAVATPLVERAVVTEYNVVTAVVTVTQTPGSYPSPHRDYRGYSHRGHRVHHKKPLIVATPSVYQPPYQPLPERTQEPTAEKPKEYTPPPANDYAGKVVRHHNVHRANHSAPDLEWDQGLADTAMKIAQTCVYAHNTDMDNGGYGQNIAAGIPAENITAAITDAFYNGEVNYYESYYGAEPSKSNFELWGHFSQIVWKGTTSVGCATYDCSGNGLSGVGYGVSPDFTVCNYKEPGNFEGEYSANVLQALGKPTVTWDY